MSSEPKPSVIDPVLAELLALVAQRAAEGRVEIGTTFEITVHPSGVEGVRFRPA